METIIKEWGGPGIIIASIIVLVAFIIIYSIAEIGQQVKFGPISFTKRDIAWATVTKYPWFWIVSSLVMFLVLGIIVYIYQVGIEITPGPSEKIAITTTTSAPPTTDWRKEKHDQNW